MNLQDFITKKPLNKGQTAKCFILENGNVFKQFNNPLSIRDVEKFKYLLNYENVNILFPFDFIYDSKKFYGYITKKATGDTLRNSFSNSNLENLSTHSIKLEKNIDYISEGKIVMHDFHSENIMYDSKLLQVIDPDEYGIRDSYNVNDIKDINFKYYRTMISNLFIFNIGINKNTEYIIDRINRYKYSQDKASEIIINIKNDMERYTKEVINTVDDFNSIIRK